MVQIEQLRFGYGREELFRDVELVLEPGNIYGLLGLNGAGKSTLLRLMTGLLFPRSGRIHVLGSEPGRRRPGLLSRLFVLPETINVPMLTDREFVGVRSPFYPGFDHERMARYVDELEIPGGRKLPHLSHGQQKKFLLAFGLASGASLLVLDEPTNGLDIPAKGLFRRLVAEALSDDRTFVVATHQVRDVESLIDRLVILHEGKVLFNQSLAAASAGLRTAREPSRPDEDAGGLIYLEPAVGGFATVRRDRSAEDHRLDLELLFKAVITNPDACAGDPWHGGTDVNDVFSPQRLRLLIRGDLIAGYRSLLVVSGALAGVILVAALATHGGVLRDGDFYRHCFGLALFVWGLVASSRAFRPLHDRTRNEAYLLIPASALEKTLARLLAVTVGLVAYLLVFIGLVSVVVETLNLLLYGGRQAFFDPFDRTVWSSIFVYIVLQSFYFLGGAWFRKAHFVKTTLALTLAVAGLACFTALTARIVFAGYWLDVGDVFFVLEQLGRARASGIGAVVHGVAFLLPLACWWIAWLRVEEVQVSDGV